MRATPPSVIAALVVTLPMMALSGGQNRNPSPKDEKDQADPDDGFQAGELCAEFASGVFLGGAEFCLGTGLFAVGDQN